SPVRAHLRDGAAHLPVVGRVRSLQLQRPLRRGLRLDPHARQRRTSLRLLAQLSLPSLSRRRISRLVPWKVAAVPALELGQYPERAPRALGVDEPHRRRLHRPVHPPSGDGRTHRPADRVLAVDVERHDYDVVVIGAGGAGLRAAIEAHALGAKTAIVCKSLLGKAHTVMAEGGIAAALGNVWPEDNWKVHFRDTMRGGKLLNNWRMAQLHAQESPDRVRELEQWGALFDRTESGDILQRAFGGHTFKRLCHVGDRTGLEMIRTLQDRGVQQGIDVYMECTSTRLLTDNGRVAGAFAYWRENGRFIVFKAKSIVIATGGIGKAWR